MTTKEHLLIILAEECAEVAHRASKALRFGLEDIEPNQQLTNAQRIMGEMNDLIAVVELLQNWQALPYPNREAVDAKKIKVRKFLAYSAERGTHSGEIERDEQVARAMAELHVQIAELRRELQQMTCNAEKERLDKETAKRECKRLAACNKMS